MKTKTILVPNKTVWTTYPTSIELHAKMRSRHVAGAQLAIAKQGSPSVPKVKVRTNHSTFKNITYHSYA
jgi:hypothetical protein